MKGFRIIFYVFVFLFYFRPLYSQNNYEQRLNSIVDQIVKNMNKASKSKIAVVEFSDLNGNITELGKFISEELITKLFLTNRFSVVERQLLNKVIQEHKLNLSGIIDPNSAKELGKILGVEAVVSGTITDLGENVKINSRLISTETGEIFAVAAEEILKNDTIKRLMGIQISGETTIRKRTSSISGDIFFKEDFSDYDVGDIAADWGRNVVVMRSSDGDNFIQNQAGNQTLNHSINFPKNFSFSFDYWGRTFGNYLVGETLTLIDTNGERLVINIFSDVYDCYITINGIRSNDLAGDNIWSNVKNDVWNNFTLVVKNNTFKCYINNKFAVSGNFEKFTNFSRLMLTVGQKKSYKNFIGRILY